MLDVHASHRPIESVREFLLHLLTITIGLLIALGLEGVVEWRHHVHLVNEARATLRDEMAFNEKKLDQAEASMKTDRLTMDANLAALKKIQQHPENKSAARNVNITASARLIDLRDTAWRAAQSSGALGYMPYEEAQRYAGVYQAIDQFKLRSSRSWPMMLA